MSHPKTVVLEGSQLTDARQRLLGGNDPALEAAKEILVAQANT